MTVRSFINLGDEGVTEIILGQSPPSTTYNAEGRGLPFYQGKSDFGLTYPRPRVWCDQGQKFGKPGDILISVRAPVGDVNVANDECVLGRGIAAIRPGRKIDPWFLYFALIHRKPDLESRATGSTFASVNRATLAGLEIPWFDPAVQVEVGNLLRLLMRKIAQEEDVVASGRKLKLAVSHRLFTRGYKDDIAQETELGPIPEGWCLKPLGSFAEVKGGKRMPKGIPLVAEDTGRPYIRVSDFDDHGVRKEGVLFVPRGYEDIIRKYRISSKEVYISIAGTIGLVGQVSGDLNDANLTENAAKIVFREPHVLPRFVMHALASPICQDQIRRVTAKNAQPKLALTRIEQLLVPMPSSEDAQAEIVGILDSVDENIRVHGSKREALSTLFRALLDGLMTGQIQLSGQPKEAQGKLIVEGAK